MMGSGKTGNSSRGFTLTEVLVAIAIFAIIFVAALLVYDRSNRVFKTSMEASDLQQETRVTFDRLVADLRMAGFDFNRDGTPFDVGHEAYEQPDEQLEFIHDHAITFRANLDYETDAANDHGREEEYEPGYSTPTDDSDDYFPLVTTANDEIVTYALKSDSGSNPDSITFYADVAKPRKTYPGGTSETLVTISGVDLCENGCEEPPYTLYRITLDDSANPVFTPLASNIRSLTLEYYSDAQQAAASLVTPNDGIGPYTVDSNGVTTSQTAEEARSLRASVQSLRMRLVGMNPNRDPNYESPVEAQLATTQPASTQPALNYRQYELETTIVPRNLGRSGMAEVPTTPPGAPLMKSACAQGCGVARVDWQAPDFGVVDSYSIIYDTSLSGSYSSTLTSAGSNLFGYVGGLDPTKTYYFKVIAKNSYGSERSSNYAGGVQPINPTKPDAPTVLTATGDGTVAAIDNDIKITFQAPDTNVSFGSGVNTCGTNEIESLQENSGYEIKRSTVQNFDPDMEGTVVFSGSLTDTGAPTVDSSGNGTFTDTKPMLNCTPYYYRIRVMEKCASSVALNTSGDTAQAYSDWSNEIMGEATSSAIPSTPTNFAIDSMSSCDGSGSCTVNLLWDRVATDLDGNQILVDEYLLRRIFYDFSAGAEVANEPGLEETTMTVTDATPGDTATQMTYQDITPDPTLMSDEPDPADRWHYYLTARQCSSVDSAETSPPAKFPCAVLSLTNFAPTVLDGTGTSPSSPYLMDTLSSSTASFEVSSTKDIGSVSISMTDLGGNSVSGGTAAISGTSTTTANFTAPLSTTTIYRVDMTVIDKNGCGSTVTRYIQGSVTNCCLDPFKTVTLTDNNTSVLTVSGAQVTIKLVNQCSASLDVDKFRIHWNSANNGFGALLSVQYPDGTTVSPPTDGENGDLSDGIAIITIPTTVTSTVDADGSYSIVLNFGKSNGDSSEITNFCVLYDGTTVCRIVQSPDQSGLQCVFP